MKIRLHETELGSNDVQKSSSFCQSVLGLQPKLQQQNLIVLDAGIPQLDFNISSHLPKAALLPSAF